MTGFLKFMRSEDAGKLLADSAAWHLLSVIAYRADRETGEAKIGDWKEMGVTSRQTYRSALKRLEAASLVTTKPTTKGTIARLVDTRVFDINRVESNHQGNHQANQQDQKKPTIKPTTNKKFKNSLIQEVKEMGVPEQQVKDWLNESRKGCRSTERALTAQLKKLNELIVMGYTAKQVFQVLTDNPSWQNITTKPYFLEALKGGTPNVKQEITDTSWTDRDQRDLQNAEPAVPRISAR